MALDLNAVGYQIQSLRKLKGYTQNQLGDFVGVSFQAVSKWERGGGYPDMEMVPAIANYFGVSIDVLFGFNPDRDRKIEEILARIDSFGIRARGDDGWVDACVDILRQGLAEFPQEERLLIKLADTLCEAGWRRHQEWTYYDEEGYIRHDYDKHRKNPYWAEAVKICEALCGTAKDNRTVTKAISILVQLYRNFGENAKAIEYANRMPELKSSREILLAAAADGKEEAKYTGDALLKMADLFAEQLVYGLVCNRHHYESDMPVEKIKGAISNFYLLCDDGNFGEYHGSLISLYLYLSRVQWERGYHDEAFQSLDEALLHARALEGFLDGKGEQHFTAPLVSFVECGRASLVETDASRKIAEKLPQDWPWWCNPDYSQVAKEMKADPRWEAWVNRTKM